MLSPCPPSAAAGLMSALRAAPPFPAGRPAATVLGGRTLMPRTLYGLRPCEYLAHEIFPQQPIVIKYKEDLNVSLDDETR